MPGVPSSRGCDMCRKQRKKCDQQKPVCSRCKRLNVFCEGAGQQRFKWHVLSTTSIQEQTTKLSDQSHDTQLLVPVFPSNQHSLLIHEYVSIIKRNIDPRYNILWTYGAFLEGLPQRLGTNHALDAAAGALAAAHADYCLHFREKTRRVSVRTLQLYGDAIKALRNVISCPGTASTTTTVCAIYLLTISQTFIGNRWPSKKQYCTSGHNAAALQILRDRQAGRPQDDLEEALELSIRGVASVESLYNPSVRMDAQEWQDFFSIKLAHYGVDAESCRSWSMVPDFIDWARQYQNSKISDDSYERRRAEAVEEYEKAVYLRKFMFERLSSHEDAVTADSTVTSVTHMKYQKAYGLSLLALMAWICVLKNIECINTAKMSKWESVAKFYTWQIFDLAIQSHLYRPVGSRYIVYCLLLAYGTVDDVNLRVMTLNMLQDFRGDSLYFNGMKTEDWDRMVSALRNW